MRATTSDEVPTLSARRTPSFGVLSTFAPTHCGLATFSAALVAGLSANGAHASVVRIADGTPSSSPRIVGELVAGSRASITATTDRLNDCDVAIVQHEYGVYGGSDGDDVVEVLAGLHVPVVVVAHTVLRDPTAHQRSVLVEVSGMADQLVVMSDAAKVRLCSGFDVDPSKVTTIPHGATVPTRDATADVAGRPRLLTFGLLGPGKGIERVIDAMPSLHELDGRPEYLIAGQTHPKVLANEGEAYRNARIEQAARRGVTDAVVFDANYRDVDSLTALIQTAAVVVLPYDSDDQVTSGVLVDAIAAGRPVIATAFPHAIELLGGGAGIVVDHDDAPALEQALRRVLTEPHVAARMADAAARLAPSMAWPVVARTYLALADRLLATRSALV